MTLAKKMAMRLYPLPWTVSRMAGGPEPRVSASCSAISSSSCYGAHALARRVWMHEFVTQFYGQHWESSYPEMTDQVCEVLRKGVRHSPVVPSFASFHWSEADGLKVSWAFRLRRKEPKYGPVDFFG